MKARTIFFGSVCLGSALCVQVQADPAKPVAGASGSMTPGGGHVGGSKGAVLSREELRSCLMLEEDVRTRLTELKSHRSLLDREKNDIAAEQEMVRADRSSLDAVKKRAVDLAARLREHGARVESWNTRVTEATALGLTGIAADRKNAEFKREREDLEVQKSALDARRQALTLEIQEAVTAFNGRVTALDTRVSRWNQRNGQWNEVSLRLESQRQDWIKKCANRSYREVDKQAIRAGR